MLIDLIAAELRFFSIGRLYLVKDDIGGDLRFVPIFSIMEAAKIIQPLGQATA
jgi:hypothetical protein